MAKGDTFSDLAEQRRNEDRSGANVQAYGFNEDWMQELEALDAPDVQAIVVSGGTMQIGGFDFTPTGIAIPEDLTPDQWQQLLTVLVNFDTSMQWYIGDAIAYGNAKFGKTYEDMAKGTRYTKDTLKLYAFVSQSLPPLIRVNDLSFAHHQAVASCKTDAEKQEWLSKALIGTDGKKWSVDKLKKAMGYKSKRVPSYVKDFRKLAKIDMENMTDRKATNARRQIANIRDWLNKIESDLDGING